jgi:hypothetical protein
MSVNAAHPPTAASIQQTMAKDLRNVYLTTYDLGTVDVGDIVDKCHVNSRYSRELLGVLEHAGLLTHPDADDTSVWAVPVDFSQDKADTEESAKEVIDGWLKEHGLAPQTPSTATSPAKERPATPRATKSKSPTGTCLCGCGSPTRSNFAPGHDAKMAGQIARAIAEQAIREDLDPHHFTNLLMRLPSDLLRDKALTMAQRICDKAVNRQQRHSPEAVERAEDICPDKAETDMERAVREGTVEPDYTYGVVKIGKNRFAARRDNDGVIMRHNKALPNEVISLTTYTEVDYTGTVEGNAAKSFKALEIQP